jgi:hypothetical protein
MFLFTLNRYKLYYKFFLVVSEVSKAGDFYLWPSFLQELSYKLNVRLYLKSR